MKLFYIGSNHSLFDEIGLISKTLNVELEIDWIILNQILSI